MKLLQSIFAVALMTLSLVVLIGCSAGIYKLWVVRQDLFKTAEALTTQLDNGLESALAAGQNAKRSQETVHEYVRMVTENSSGLELGSARNRESARYLRSLIGRLKVFSDASATTTTLRQNFQKMPVGQISFFNSDKLNHAAERSAQMSATLQKLELMLGAEEKEFSEEELIAVATKMDDALQEGDETIDDWLSELDDARVELSRFSARIFSWLTAVTVTLTVFFAWIALSQVSVLAHGWKWYQGHKRRRAVSPTATQVSGSVLAS
jgi:methyl-accepting chemotaxis protein